MLFYELLCVFFLLLVVEFDWDADYLEEVFVAFLDVFAKQLAVDGQAGREFGLLIDVHTEFLFDIVPD